MHVFERTQHGAKRAPVTTGDRNDPQIAALVDERTYREFIDSSSCSKAPAPTSTTRRCCAAT